MARWEKFGAGEILTSLVRYVDHEDEQECELEMVLLADARRGLEEEVKRLAGEIDRLQEELAQQRDAIRLARPAEDAVDERARIREEWLAWWTEGNLQARQQESWEAALDRICPEENQGTVDSPSAARRSE